MCFRVQSREQSAQELQDWNDEDLIVDRAEAEAYERERVARERRHIEEREKAQAAHTCIIPRAEHAHFTCQVEAAANQKVAAEAAHEKALTQVPRLALLWRRRCD